MIKSLLILSLLFISPVISADLSENDINCLALNIYHEARNESPKGHLAVYFVTLNRVKDIKYPSTVCGVVKQITYSKRYKKRVAQFSWYLDGLPDTPYEVSTYIHIVNFIKVLQLLKVEDLTNGATNYHANYVKPRWASKLTYLKTIDSHLFYK